MKVIITMLSLILLGVLELTAADHIPPCGGYPDNHPGYSNCRGYAVARAYGRGWDDPICGSGNLCLSIVSTQYFDKFEIPKSKIPLFVEVNDILNFGDWNHHVAYVYNSALQLAEVYGPGYPERDSLSVGEVESMHGTFKGYWRLKEDNPVYYSVTVENHFEGIGNTGVIKVEGTQYNLPRIAFSFEEDRIIEIEAVNGQNISTGIYYKFDRWHDGNTTRIRNFTINSDIIITAYFTGTPTAVTHVRDVGLIGESIEIEWDQHPNAHCIYKIWRAVKVQRTGKTTISFLATLPHSTTSYTDDHYTKTRTYTKYLLKYDVRAYYTIENTSAEPNYNLTIYGGGPLEKIAAKGDSIKNIICVSDKYDVIAYPNPFNTSTVISYQLVDEGFVSLNIYDMLGRKAIEILSEPNQAGIYTIRWNGQDDAGNSLPSGIYLYRFCVRPHSGGERFQKVGKLFFAK